MNWFYFFRPTPHKALKPGTQAFTNFLLHLFIVWPLFFAFSLLLGLTLLGFPTVQMLKAYDDATLPEATFTKNYPLGPAFESIARADLDKVIAAMRSRRALELKRYASKDIPAPTQTEKDAFSLAHRILRGISPREWAKLRDTDLEALSFGLLQAVAEEARATNDPYKKQNLSYELWAIFGARLAPNETRNIFETRLKKAYWPYGGGTATSNALAIQQRSEFPLWWVFAEKVDKLAGSRRVENDIAMTLALPFMFVCLIATMIRNARQGSARGNSWSKKNSLSNTCDLAFLYYAVADDFNAPEATDILAGLISERYRNTRDPFEKHHLLESLKPQIIRRIISTKQKRNVVIDSQGLQLSKYDFRINGFTLGGGESRGSAEHFGDHVFWWRTNGVRVDFVVRDVKTAKAIEQLRQDEALRSWSTRTYAFAEEEWINENSRKTVSLRIQRVELLDDKKRVVSTFVAPQK